MNLVLKTGHGCNQEQKQQEINNMRTFIVQMIPDELLGSCNCSQAANNFCRNLIKSKAFNRVITVVPIQVVDDISLECSQMPEIDTVIQCRRFPHRGIGRVLNMVLENLALFRAVFRDEKIWFYNITTCNMLCFLLLWLFRRQVYVLLADFTPPRHWFDPQQLVKFCLCRAKGLLSLSGRIGLKHANCRIIPGIIPEGEVYLPETSKLERRFIFSGTLSAVTGFDMAIEVFSRNPDLPLTITGSSSKEEEYREKLRKYANIDFCGRLGFEDYRKKLSRMAWALNLRNPHLPENEYNFPSKFLEYMTCGKIVLSTMKYPELDGFKYFYADFSADDIADKLRRIMLLSEDEQQEIRRHNHQQMYRFSGRHWCETIEEIDQ